MSTAERPVWSINICPNGARRRGADEARPPSWASNELARRPSVCLFVCLWSGEKSRTHCALGKLVAPTFSRRRRPASHAKRPPDARSSVPARRAFVRRVQLDSSPLIVGRRRRRRQKEGLLRVGKRRRRRSKKINPKHFFASALGASKEKAQQVCGAIIARPPLLCMVERTTKQSVGRNCSTLATPQLTRVALGPLQPPSLIRA